MTGDVQPAQSAQPEQPAQSQTQAVGRWVGVGCVVLTGTGLLAMIWPSRSLGLLLALITLAQALIARRVGTWAGPLIAQRSFRYAPVLGALSGAIVLGTTALSAMGVGLCWGLLDGLRSSDWAYSYLLKPPLAVLIYGWFLALLLGAVGGVLIRVLAAWLARRSVPRERR